MIARGNLNDCIIRALTAYHAYRYPMLAILHNATGHYYTVVTEEELVKLSTEEGQRRHRLMFHGTHREILSFCVNTQTTLDLGDHPDADPTTTES